ncbi:MAG: hypothetical protein WCC58_11770 [Burkholderiales bacterium]
MPGTIDKHIAHSGTRLARGAKTSKPSDANAARKPSVRQRARARNAVDPQGADEDKFTAPFDPAERHTPLTALSDAKRQNLQAAEEDGGVADGSEDLDNLLNEGGDDVAESDI